MTDTYDLVVIGSGTAAQVASTRVGAAGWKVAVIDHRPFGGTCALRGCDPKKMLISAAEAVDAAYRMRGKGVAGELGIDWRQLIGFKRSFTDPIPMKHEQRYAQKGIETVHGIARFTGPDTLAVADQELKARFILIASGACPIPLEMTGEEHVITSEQFLELDSLPAHIVLIGGGYIAAEFSHIAARAGAHVTIFQRAERMLPAFDPDLVSWLMDKFHELGIDVRTHATVKGVHQCAAGLVVNASMDGQPWSVTADLVVHAAGRKPDLGDLDLEAANVATEHGKLKLNEFLQSVSNPHIYAAGDAAGCGPPLTPISSHDGKVVAANLLEGNHRTPNYRGVPSVAFTIPPIASVGLSEASAREQGFKFRVKAERTSDWYTARRLNERVYGFKTLIEEGTGHILGAHLVGPHAEDDINLFGLAIRHHLSADDLKTTMFAYPTGASDIGDMV